VSFKAYCIIPTSWTLEELARHTCADGSHFHASWSDIYAFMLDGVTVEHVVERERRRQRGVVKLHHLGVRVNDLSCRVGAPLIVAVEMKRPWAKVMLEEILNGVTSV